MNSDTTCPDKHIVFLPFAGGSSEYYLPWAKNFSPGITCHYPSLRGRGRLFHSPARDNVIDLVNDILPSILELTDEPISFFGHSMGGLIAYELAKKLIDQYGIVPEHIFISAFRPPHIPHQREPLHVMSDYDLYIAIKDLGGISADFSYNEIKPFLPTLAADFKLCETYKCMHSSSLPCQMTVMWGAQDKLLPLNEMKRWQDKSDFNIENVIFKGGHFYLSENVLELAEIIESTILE